MKLSVILLFLQLWGNVEVSLSQNASSCDRPPAFGGFTVEGLPENDDPIVPGQVIVFRCDDPEKYLEGLAALMCLEGGQWNDRFPSCIEPVGCQSPPPLTDGDLRYTMKRNYSHNERVEYMCQAHYWMLGGPYRICTNGGWAGRVRCLKPCIVDDNDMSRHNITFKYSNNKKLYSTHNDDIEFRCTRGRPVGTMRRRCNDGVMLLPSCQ